MREVQDGVNVLVLMFVKTGASIYIYIYIYVYMVQSLYLANYLLVISTSMSLIMRLLL